MTEYTETRDTVFDGKNGRDAGKRFRVKEVPPVIMAGFVLRLLSALRMVAQEDLFAFLQPRQGETDLTGILHLLTGCDPQAVHALITDALTHVEVAPDPQHPGMFRPVRAEDIQEMATLGDVLGAFARTNLLPG